MIVLTRRPALHKILAGLEHWALARETKFIKTVGELERYGCEIANIPRRHQLLTLDLELVAAEPVMLVPLMGWIRRFPWLHPVSVVTLIKIRDQIMALDAIKTEFAYASTIHMFDLTHLDIWDAIHRTAMARMQLPVLSDAFVQWGLVHGRVFAAQALVLRALAIAPRVQRVEQLALLLGRSRLALWRELDEAGQMHPKEMLTVFHLLYAVHMRHLGWSPDVISHYLGYESHRALMRCLSRNLETPAVLFFERPEAQVMEWAAETLTSSSALVETKPPVSLKSHVERFVQA